jgi:hypothetical protein
MSDYTKKGYRLVHVSGTVFECLSEHVVIFDAEKNACTKASSFSHSRLVVQCPCTQAEILRVLRAWLTAYEDDELLEQVDGVVRKAIEGLPAASNPPAIPAQKGMN